MANKAMANKTIANNNSNKAAKVMVNKNQITTANSSKADTANQVKKTKPEALEAATTNNRAVKPMANNNMVVRLMAQGNMVKDRAILGSNNQATASQDMISKLKVTVGQVVLRKVTAASWAPWVAQPRAASVATRRAMVS